MPRIWVVDYIFGKVQLEAKDIVEALAKGQQYFNKRFAKEAKKQPKEFEIVRVALVTETDDDE